MDDGPSVSLCEQRHNLLFMSLMRGTAEYILSYLNCWKSHTRCSVKMTLKFQNPNISMQQQKLCL